MNSSPRFGEAPLKLKPMTEKALAMSFSLVSTVLDLPRHVARVLERGALGGLNLRDEIALVLIGQKRLRHTVVHPVRGAERDDETARPSPTGCGSRD